MALVTHLCNENDGKAKATFTMKLEQGVKLLVSWNLVKSCRRLERS